MGAWEPHLPTRLNGLLNRKYDPLRFVILEDSTSQKKLFFGVFIFVSTKTWPTMKDPSTASAFGITFPGSSRRFAALSNSDSSMGNGMDLMPLSSAVILIRAADGSSPSVI